MARSFNGTSDKATVTGAVVTAVPFTVACWFNTSKTTGNQGFVNLSDGTANNLFGLRTNGTNLMAQTVSAASATSASSTTTFSASTWAHACAVFASATDRRVFLNGEGKGTNATSKIPTGINTAFFGVGPTGAAAFLTAQLAEVGIWNVALADADVAVLALGVSPLLVRPDALVAYYPFQHGYSPEIDLSSTRTAALTGTTVSAHPRMLRAHSPQFMPPRSATQRTVVGGRHNPIKRWNPAPTDPEGEVLVGPPKPRPAPKPKPTLVLPKPTPALVVPQMSMTAEVVARTNQLMSVARRAAITADDEDLLTLISMLEDE